MPISKQNIKIKFDYAVISADDLRKTINPSDSDLEAFFKKNAARYAQAVPEERKITYFAFTQDQVPGGVPQPSQQQIQEYYNDHLSDYSVPDQARSRHILISVPQGADAKTDAAAKAKAEMHSEAAPGGRKLGGSGEEIFRRPGQQGLRRRAGICAARQDGAGVRQGHLHAKDRRHRHREEQLRLSHYPGGRAPERAHTATERSAGKYCCGAHPRCRGTGGVKVCGAVDRGGEQERP